MTLLAALGADAHEDRATQFACATRAAVSA
jgi:hypothetical protein